MSDSVLRNDEIEITPEMLEAALPIFTNYFMLVRVADPTAIRSMLSDTYRAMAGLSKGSRTSSAVP